MGRVAVFLYFGNPISLPGWWIFDGIGLTEWENSSQRRSSSGTAFRS
jgi:hypothetical protein